MGRGDGEQQGEDKERRDGFAENLYDLISGISDLIV